MEVCSSRIPFRFHNPARSRGRLTLTLPAHHLASDLPYLVLDSSTSVSTLIHRELVHAKQERRRLGSCWQPLFLPYMGETLVMLARPVHVDTA
jgi:hypothetical protein